LDLPRLITAPTRAETIASTLAIECTAALKRLEAALTEHRRRHAGLATDRQLARSDLGAERLQAVKLNGESRAVSAFLLTLTASRDLLRGRLAQCSLVTPRPGAVFGEELPRLVGQYFPKGAEICRVADTGQLLARIPGIADLKRTMGVIPHRLSSISPSWDTQRVSPRSHWVWRS
jgi:hypothetical protein